MGVNVDDIGIRGNERRSSRIGAKDARAIGGSPDLGTLYCNVIYSCYNTSYLTLPHRGTP